MPMPRPIVRLLVLGVLGGLDIAVAVGFALLLASRDSTRLHTRSQLNWHKMKCAMRNAQRARLHLVEGQFARHEVERHSHSDSMI